MRLLKVYAGVLLCSFALFANAQTPVAQTEEQTVIQLNYDQTNVHNGPKYGGYSLETQIPFAKTTVALVPLSFELDVSVAEAKNNSTNSNVGYLKGGIKTNFTGWQVFTPYFAVGVQGNNGNFVNQMEDYVAYYVEPGVRIDFDKNFYALAAYEYGEGFNSEVGSVRNMPKVGVGVNFTKNLGAEVRYEMNQGSYQFNRTVAGLKYMF